MKDLHLQDQASAIRRPKSSTDLSKNLRKASKKKPSPAFEAVSGDESAVLEHLKEFSEVSDDNPFAESAENFTPLDTPSSNKVDISLTSPVLSQFSVVTSDNLVTLDASDTEWEIPGAD